MCSSGLEFQFDVDKSSTRLLILFSFCANFSSKAVNWSLKSLQTSAIFYSVAFMAFSITVTVILEPLSTFYNTSVSFCCGSFYRGIWGGLDAWFFTSFSSLATRCVSLVDSYLLKLPSCASESPRASTGTSPNISIACIRSMQKLLAYCLNFLSFNNKLKFNLLRVLRYSFWMGIEVRVRLFLQFCSINSIRSISCLRSVWLEPLRP